MDALQILGYAASIVIFISLTMKSLVKLRLINAVGSLLFVIFALKTNSLPTVALNAGLVIINMYYFFRMMRSKDNFDIMEVRKDNEIITRFCEKHRGELDAIFGSEALDACTNLETTTLPVLSAMLRNLTARAARQSCSSILSYRNTATLQSPDIFSSMIWIFGAIRELIVCRLTLPLPPAFRILNESALRRLETERFGKKIFETAELRQNAKNTARLAGSS